MASEANLSFWIKNQYNVIFRGKHGCGKCLGKGTQILMFDGTIKMVEEIKKDDILMGPDSRPRKVLSTCSGIEDLYRIIPTKGDSYVVNSSHILSLKMCSTYTGYDKNSIVNMNVVEFINKSNQFRTRALGWRTGVDFDHKEVPIDPYFIGLWLGDGTSATSGVTTGDIEIIEYLKTFADANKLQCYEIAESGCSTIRINSGPAFPGCKKNGRNHLFSSMQNLHLINNKHIPQIYKSNSRKIRLELLAGLIDSDGHLSNNCYDIISKYEILADDICFLARSLGFAAYKKESKKGCWYNGEYKEGTYFRITISGNIQEVPVKLKRKKAFEHRSNRDVLKTHLEIEPLGKGEYFGFEIDGDHLFLLGDFTVTHNTTKILNAFSAHGLKFQYFSASTMDPWVDFIGVPKEKIDANGNSYLDLVRPKHFQDDQVEAIFLDEFNRSSKKVRNAVMELIQFKSINGKKFNNLKVVWAAINPEDDEDGKYDVEALDPAQLDRFHVVVDVPYIPDADYFRKKYGKDQADVAITWWKELDKKNQNLVSPRRLDYVLDMYKNGGDIKFVLPNSVNCSKLLLELSVGSISKKLQSLFNSKKTDEAKEFLNVENNFAASKEYIKKNQNYVIFFCPLISDEKLIGLMLASKLAEDYVFNNYDKYESLIKDIAASKSNQLSKRANQVITSRANYLAQQAKALKALTGTFQSANTFAKSAYANISESDAIIAFSSRPIKNESTYDRIKIWEFYNKNVPKTITDIVFANSMLNELTDLAESFQIGTQNSIKRKRGFKPIIELLNHVCDFFIKHNNAAPFNRNSLKRLQLKYGNDFICSPTLVPDNKLTGSNLTSLF